MATKPSAAKTAAPKKTTPRSTAAKSRGPKPKAASVAAPSDPAPVQPAEARPAMQALRVKDLVEAVLTRTAGKKKETRTAVEATLAVIGEALSKGQGLNLPPLGRAKVNRQKEIGDSELLVVKFKRDSAGKPAKKLESEGVAETGE